MLSARRSRHRIPIALVASCLMGSALPGVFCPVVCLTHEAMALHGPHEGQVTTVPPCHTGDGVKAAQPRGDLTLVALPAGGRVVLGSSARPTVPAQPPMMLHSAVLETRTPPPRLG